MGDFLAHSATLSVRKGDWFLSYLPVFVAMSVIPFHPFRGDFVLRSLSGVLATVDGVSLLCPVRALRSYRLRPGVSYHSCHLFVSVLDLLMPMSKAAISFFVRTLLMVARPNFPNHLASLL